MRRSPLAWCLVLAIGAVVSIVSCGCESQRVYSADNSARGKEDLSLPVPVWPDANPAELGCSSK